MTEVPAWVAVPMALAFVALVGFLVVATIVTWKDR